MSYIFTRYFKLKGREDYKMQTRILAEAIFAHEDTKHVQQKIIF